MNRMFLCYLWLCCVSLFSRLPTCFSESDLLWLKEFCTYQGKRVSALLKAGRAIQLSPDNSNLHGKSREVQVIGKLRCREMGTKDQKFENKMVCVSIRFIIRRGSASSSPVSPPNGRYCSYNPPSCTRCS